MRLVLLWAMLLIAGLSSLASAEDEGVSKQFQGLLAEEWEYTLREAPTFSN